MALTKKPVTGMKDITPAEMQIREYVMNQIRETYKGLEGLLRYLHNNGTAAVSGHNADRCLPDHFLPLQSLNSACRLSLRS